MHRFTNYCVVGIAAVILAGCATVEQVRRASDLIRTDNELTRLLVEVRHEDKAVAGAYLEGLAKEAKSKADELGKSNATYADAIGYYRIAAAASWRSGSTELVNELFAAADAGQILCTALGNDAPDRDCLFLQLVVPFAGLEQHANDKGLAMELDKVNFNDGNATKDEVGVMDEVGDALTASIKLVGRILAMSKDDRYLTQTGMTDYFCRNARKALRYHNGLVIVYVAKVKDYKDKFGDAKAKLGITVDEARKKKVDSGIPSFCN
ncbi:hypothetical protein ACFL7M_15750 [Thermodesulfobacteriota bacterium]